MTTPLPAALAEVLALADVASAGPWWPDDEPGQRLLRAGQVREYATIGALHVWTDEFAAESEANADLICAAVNLLRDHGPALTRLLAAPASDEAVVDPQRAARAEHYAAKYESLLCEALALYDACEFAGPNARDVFDRVREALDFTKPCTFAALGAKP